MAFQLQWHSPTNLKDHPLNTKLYGNGAPPADLVASVKEHGVLQPLLILPDTTVIAGHRRKNAAKVAGANSIPCIVRDDLRDPLEIERLLIVSNKDNRDRDRECKAREAARLAEIEEAQAKIRETAGKKPDPMAHAPQGTTRANVAKELGVGERQAGDLIKAGKALNDAERKGHEKKAEKIKAGLKKSASAGAAAAKPQAPSGGQTTADKLTANADRLIAKLSGDFSKVVDALGPLVNVFDDIKASDSSFSSLHKALLGHHSRLFASCEEGKKALAALKAAWNRK